MVPQSRRRFLSLCAGSVVVAAAGCSSGEQSSDSDPPSFPDEEDVVVDPPTYTTRVDAALDGSESLLTYEQADDDDGRGSLPYVTKSEDAEALRFRQRPPDYEGVREFLHGTDYDTESVVFEETAVGACYRFAVQYVELRSDGSVSLQLCRVLRDPSVACSLEERHHQLTLVRVPIADDSPPSRFGFGTSSSCRLPPEHPAATGGEDE